jgi:MscS family membrane protein
MLILALAAAAAITQGSAAPAAEPPAAAAPAPDSPRHAVESFLDAAHDGRDQDAAVYLELSPAQARRGRELAHELAEVLDDEARIDLDGLSTSPDGDTTDGLPTGRDRVTRVGDPDRGDPVEVVRVTRAGASHWLFSSTTIAHVDAWHARIERPWIEAWLPDPLLEVGPGGLLLWQWIAAGLLFVLALAIAWPLGSATRKLLAAMTGRVRGIERIAHHVRGPLIWAWTVMLWWLAVPRLALTPTGASTVYAILRLLIFYGFFWLLLRFVDLAIELVRSTPWAKHHAFSHSLLQLSARAGKSVIVVIAAISIVSELGYPIASILAGLGIGGIAVALAAQKTVENLFGAFSLGVDQPFREGDTIRIDGAVTGTVERVGLRSTRLRTPDRLVLSIPNGKLAEARIESYAAVDRVRLQTTLHLHVATTPDAVRAVLDGLRGLLAHGAKAPALPPDVHFVGITDHSLDVSVVAWFDGGADDDLASIQDAFLLGCIDTVARAGTSLAGAPTARPPRAAADRPASTTSAPRAT